MPKDVGYYPGKDKSQSSSGPTPKQMKKAQKENPFAKAAKSGRKSGRGK